ncbi:MAG: Rrf2 family transcriptional regulator [Akkermansiaceae bacterium]
MQVGKTAQNAISAVSYLVERQRDGHGTVSSQEVADARNFSKPLAAKILTTLSKVGIIKGSTGPGGGYHLAKPAAEISLLDVVSQFELQNNAMMCPFGEGWCGNYDPCPLHDKIAELESIQMKFLSENNFGGFEHEGYSSKRPD